MPETQPALYGFLYGSAPHGLGPGDPLLDPQVPVEGGIRFDGDPLMLLVDGVFDVHVEAGDFTRTGGLSNAVLLSWFGPNEDDSGRIGDPLAYWGALVTAEPAEQLRGGLQLALRTLPPTVVNLAAVRSVARQDLEWLLTEGVASAVEVAASLESSSRLRLQVTVEQGAGPQSFAYLLNWAAGA